MECKIKRILIKSLWGVKDISTDFFPDVNIFIGSNGSSKTTFLNLLEAVLVCDIEIFRNIYFDSITIDFDLQENSQLVVNRVNDEDICTIKYLFADGSSYDIPCIDSILRPYRGVSSKYRETFYALKERLASITNISWLSINRDNLSYNDLDRNRDYVDRIRNMVDYKLIDLIRSLVGYQLQLESEANRNANKFKEEVLSLMLFNESFDKYNFDNIARFELADADQMRRDLYRAFNYLGVVKDKKDLINRHIQQIKDVITKVTKQQQSIEFDDLLVLSLINRTLSIIEISKEHEKNTNEIFAPMELFWKCLKRFMPNKEFNLNNDKQVVLKESSNNIEIDITSLSSGEKQLFILLAEALLQKGVNYLFIADEPELSLHIDWQRKILAELLNLNPNSQIIVATHSPEIAGNFPLNIINMQDIICYE